MLDSNVRQITGWQLIKLRLRDRLSLFCYDRGWYDLAFWIGWKL